MCEVVNQSLLAGEIIEGREIASYLHYFKYNPMKMLSTAWLNGHHLVICELIFISCEIT